MTVLDSRPLRRTKEKLTPESYILSPSLDASGVSHVMTLGARIAHVEARKPALWGVFMDSAYRRAREQKLTIRTPKRGYFSAELFAATATLADVRNLFSDPNATPIPEFSVLKTMSGASQRVKAMKIPANVPHVGVYVDEGSGSAFKFLFDRRGRLTGRIVNGKTVIYKEPKTF